MKSSPFLPALLFAVALAGCDRDKTRPDQLMAHNTEDAGQYAIVQTR